MGLGELGAAADHGEIAADHDQVGLLGRDVRGKAGRDAGIVVAEVEVRQVGDAHGQEAPGHGRGNKPGSSKAGSTATAGSAGGTGAKIDRASGRMWNSNGAVRVSTSPSIIALRVVFLVRMVTVLRLSICSASSGAFAEQHLGGQPDQVGRAQPLQQIERQRTGIQLSAGKEAARPFVIGIAGPPPPPRHVRCGSRRHCSRPGWPGGGPAAGGGGSSAGSRSWRELIAAADLFAGGGDAGNEAMTTLCRNTCR